MFFSKNYERIDLERMPIYYNLHKHVNVNTTRIAIVLLLNIYQHQKKILTDDKTRETARNYKILNFVS